MATGPMTKLIRHLHQAALRRDGAGLADAQLLQRFVTHRDEAAFAALVRRHGPMVWGVCRRGLHNRQDAEDAFQATFLILARKAASIASRDLLANWLYGVAYRAACKARAAAALRGARERQVREMPEPAARPPNDRPDWQPVLDRELSRLPDKYRSVILLCDLEGKTRKEAARQLGCPEGTVAGRLARARAMLAKRLTRHGLTVSAGSVAAAFGSDVLASVPPAACPSALEAATLLAAGKATTGVLAAQVAILAKGVMKMMLLDKLKSIAVVFLVLVLALGSGLMLAGAGAEDQKPEKPVAEERPAEVVRTTAWELQSVYEDNDALADEKFTGKEVVAEGVFTQVRRVEIPSGISFGRDERTSYILRVEGFSKDAPVWFDFAPKDRKQLASLEPRRQEVTVRGKCVGRFAWTVNGRPQEVILVVNCRMVNVKPYTPEKHLSEGLRPVRP